MCPSDRDNTAALRLQVNLFNARQLGYIPLQQYYIENQKREISKLQHLHPIPSVCTAVAFRGEPPTFINTEASRVLINF
ncbi:hypothetical protein M758_8G044000 [Ceratodon purpureus]|nr:hypothetical protein M758_8G044000 [Ceratodon purpureus]